MNDHTERIQVRSHVGRDLLQSAGLFTKDKHVVWEYVSNGLQYVDNGVGPVVRVTINNSKHQIAIQDNGRGMDWEGLQNFFFMHGENLDRKQGRGGRGYFGTGKSAAFGIADLLRVTTVKDGKRSKLELARKDIEKYDSGDNIPLRILEREVPSPEPNGTLIEIEQIQIKAISQRDIIVFIERHLARWNRGVKVWVNSHLCEFSEPFISKTHTFEAEGEIGQILGPVKLIVKVSNAPLEEDLRGVSIFSNSVWHETTLAGNEKEMSQYIFGEVDVPKLDYDKSPIRPFNVSRSMRLNVENEIVRTIYAFIGQSVEIVRRELLEEEKRRKSDELSKKLESQAREIADLINDDFNDYRSQLAKARAHASGGYDNFDPLDTEFQVDPEGESLAFGTQTPAEIVSADGALGAEGNGESDGGDPRQMNPEVQSTSDDSEHLGTSAAEVSTKRKSRGGFQIEFRNHGSENMRARYAADERTIYVNLDHAQLVNALSNRTVDDIVFKRLAYEVAFAEYAIALSSELARQGAYLDFFEPISDIRETMNRIATKAAYLYTE